MYFLDGQVVDDVLEVIEVVVDDVLGDVLQVVKFGKGFECVIKVVFGKVVKQFGQCFSVEYWVVYVFDVLDMLMSSVVVFDYFSDVLEFWLLLFFMVLMFGLCVVCVCVFFFLFQVGFMLVFMLCFFVCV